MSSPFQLQPQYFPHNPKRAEATRTVLQSDIDKFEYLEAERAKADHAMSETQSVASVPAQNARRRKMPILETAAGDAT